MSREDIIESARIGLYAATTALKEAVDAVHVKPTNGEEVESLCLDAYTRHLFLSNTEVNGLNFQGGRIDLFCSGNIPLGYCLGAGFEFILTID